MTSQLYSASCFESMPSSTSNASLKQPLVEVQDLESSSSSSSQGVVEQKTDNERRGLSSLILVKSLCFGSFVGLLLQAVTFSAFLVTTKRWGRNPQPEESAALSYWTLYLLIHMDIAVYCIMWGGFLMTLTRKGSMYMRKKFDNDADAPNTESVWTQRFLFHSGVGVLLGVIAGSYTAWVIIDIELGFPVSLTPLFSTLLMDVWLCYLLVKCFDWGQVANTHDEPEEDDEDSFLVFK